MDIEKAIRNFKLRGFSVQHFAAGEEAAAYLCGQIRNTTVGIGGSKTADQLGLYEKLSEQNTVFSSNTGMTALLSSAFFLKLS